MKKYSLVFIPRFAITALLLGFIFIFVGNLTNALLASVANWSGMNFMVVQVIVPTLYRVLAVYLAVSYSIQYSVKKDCESLYNENKFFIIFFISIILINIVYSIFFYTSTYNSCLNNINFLELSSKHGVDGAKLKVRSFFNLIFIISCLISSVLFTLMIPLSKKMYKKYLK